MLFPITLFCYKNDKKVLHSVFNADLSPNTIDKLKGFSLRGTIIKKDTIMICLYRTEVGFPDPIGCEGFWRLGTNCSILTVIEEVLNNFRRNLTWRIEKAKECFGIDAINYKRKE